ncbi:hypothetical protein ES703_111106 [subsurface metagenome]
MKFLVDECLDCGLDLTAVEPAEVTRFGDTVSGTCPQCGRSYIMVDVTPGDVTPPPPEPEPVVEPEPELKPKPRSRRRASEPEPVNEPETPPEE